MHFIELLLGLSVFVFIFGLIPYSLLKETKYAGVIVFVGAMAIFLIVICLGLYICNVLITCITVWFGNW